MDFKLHEIVILSSVGAVLGSCSQPVHERVAGDTTAVSKPSIDEAELSAWLERRDLTEPAPYERVLNPERDDR